MMRKILVAGAMLPLLAVATLAADRPDWPAFRGPNLDGTVAETGAFGEAVALDVAWKLDYGSGYASLVSADGLLIGGLSSGDHDVLAALDVATGEEKWRYTIGPIYKGHDGSHDGPIATPLISGGRVYMLGAWGELFALDLATGKEIWRTHLVEDHEIPKPWYGFTASPILVDGVLVVLLGDAPPPQGDGEGDGEGEAAPEGKTGQAVGGFDPATGALKWTLGSDRINYQSPTVATIGGKRLVIASGDTKLFGIDAAAGKIAFEYDHGGDGRAIGSASLNPVVGDDGKILLNHKADGSTMVRVKPDPELGYAVEELWSNNSIRGTYVTPVLHGGHIYGVTGRVLTCVDAETGETRWRSRQPGDGFLTLIDDHLIIQTKAGSLHVARATPDGYREVAQLPLFEELSWSQVAFADGALFSRSMNEVARIDITSTGAAADGSGVAAAPRGSSFAEFLAELETAEDPAARIDAFLAEQDGFPIVEGMDLVHFVYRGDAEDMGVRGDIIGARREDPMTRVPGTDFFYYSKRFEPTARVNYGFIKNFEENIVDPLNDRKESDGQGGELSWFAMPAWDAPWYLAEAPPERQGRLVEHTVESAVLEGHTMKLDVYLPAGYDSTSDRLPTIYVLEGNTALEEGRMKHALDNLIGKSVAPLIAVFMHPLDPQPQGRPDWEALGRMLDAEVVALVDANYRTDASRASRAIFGAGGSGYTAYAMAFQAPDLFGRVFTQSAILFGGQLDALKQMVRNADAQPLTIYQDWGTYDLRSEHEAWDMRESNANFRSFLRDRGYRPVGGEVPTGLGWGSWTSQTDDVLETFYPLGS